VTAFYIRFQAVNHSTLCVEIFTTTLADYPEIRIVITSSWREEKTLTELQNYLAPVLSMRVVGVTPVIDEPFLHHVRYHEVQAYLKNTMQVTTPWVALDDELGNYPVGAPTILVNRKTGLTVDDGMRIKQLLNKITSS